MNDPELKESFSAGKIGENRNSQKAREAKRQDDQRTYNPIKLLDL